VKAAIRWMARNHVAANILMVVLIVGGLIKGFSIKQEVFPEVDLDRVQVSVAYPGAGPEEVEEGILRQIEENLTGIDGIKEITSSASEGIGVVTAEVASGEDVDLVLQDIKSEVDRIVTFPEDAEKPVIAKLVNRAEVISVVVYGDVSDRVLREQADEIRDELLALPGITQVDLGGVRPYEISIEIPEENLRRYGLTLEEVARRIRRASLDLPGGTIKTEGGEILLRTKERRYFGPEYSDITVVTSADGVQVKLADIARIKDDFEETDVFARFDGVPAAMVKVFRVGDQKPIEISNRVKEYVKGKTFRISTSVNIAVWFDTSEIYQSRINLLLKNAGLGLTLVLIILGLFLEIRLALWVMLGIPISFFGAMLLMPTLDVSINMLSLFAFILALGILVDDAIVVGENVFEQRQKGKPYVEAAVDGTIEVGIPVIYAVLTTVAAFLPLVFVSGVMGKFIKVIPLVVIALLVMSLIESLFVLPAHLSGGRPNNHVGRGFFGALERVRLGFGKHLDRFVAETYRPFLERCMRYRYTTVAAGIAVLFLTLGVVRGGILKFTFMPEVEGDMVIASIKMPSGTPAEETGKVAQFVVEEGKKVVEELDRDKGEGNSIMRNIFSLVGTTLARRGPGGGQTASASHVSEIAMFLAESKDRGIPAAEVANRWREAVGDLPGVDSVTFTSSLFEVGTDIDVRAAHADFDVLDSVAGRIKRSLAEYPGVGNIDDSLSRGKRELKIQLRPEARTLGVTEEELGRQIRSAFYGAEALRLQRGRNEVKVMVRYPKEDRRKRWNLESMRIRTPDEGEIALAAAADVSEGWGYASINRTDRKRVVNVTATVDASSANAQEILLDMQENLFPKLAIDYPGLTFDLVGEEKERKESMDSMKKGFTMALIGIFALLAIPFRSYSQPLLIMAAIPFGVVGAVAGHLIMGYSLSILSFFGIVALAGVVVNDSLLLIDTVNIKRRGGVELFTALGDAGTRRFRPILLTSLTTFFGLTPMILETSVQAQFLIPMAISLGFGILFATGITLLLIPCLYLMLEDVRGLFGLGMSQARGESEASR
jgi:multidrug efflux pump subunit AcrB